MKKIFLSLAILAVSSLSILAQDNNVCRNGSVCNKEVCKNEVCNNGACGNSNICNSTKDCVNTKKNHRRYCESRAFEGINLTDAQKAKLDELKKTRDDQKKKDAFCQNKDCNKPGCLKKDCEVRKNMTPEQKKQLKTELRAKKMESRKKILSR